MGEIPDATFFIAMTLEFDVHHMSFHNSILFSAGCSTGRRNISNPPGPFDPDAPFGLFAQAWVARERKRPDRDDDRLCGSDSVVTLYPVRPLFGGKLILRGEAQSRGALAIDWLCLLFTIGSCGIESAFCFFRPIRDCGTAGLGTLYARVLVVRPSASEDDWRPMICPHCLVAFSPVYNQVLVRNGAENIIEAAAVECPECKKSTAWILVKTLNRVPNPTWSLSNWIMAYPKSHARVPVCPDVPKELQDDYTEACAVLPDSAKASAALSRRCLQAILRDYSHTKAKDLADQIEEVISSGKLPSYLSAALDGIRVVGNFAAHPIKSKSTGEIVDVEAGEAEWCLDVVERLFDFYFAQPALLKKQREQLNKKLAEAGKPPLR